ncbi:MAG TPA: polysaccharide deacetylase family protein [Candidatus Woesebacteria bacterium]|nr:polysaccharide deacetylase family protein [Candidatus Woesebacteria bacterium]
MKTVSLSEVLNILKQAGIPATFYVIGSEVEKSPEIAKRIVAEGHELDNHSYSHPRFYLKSQKELEIKGEQEQTNFLVNYTVEHTTAGSIIILHPFCDEACKPTRNALPEIITKLKEQGYRFVTISELIE